jgi:3',5'-cyclic AMP phosphodiesterase CpdA
MRVAGTLWAVSDLHVAYAENRKLVESIEPESAGDWLIVAGDVAEVFGHVEATLRLLRSRFAEVIWVPGNHELWTHKRDPLKLRGAERYDRLIAMCRDLGVTTPQDEFLTWRGDGGPAVIAPLFTLYDYTWRAPGTTTKEESLAYAYNTGVVCTDEELLQPDPHEDRESWCRARVAESEKRLAAVDPELPLVLVNHWPLHRHPTEVLWYPEFAQWCGTELTEDWHRRFNVRTVVYGHLHIPRTTWQDGVPFQEVSVGYPREWKKRATPPALLRKVLEPSGQ